jgi:ABC-2 type transport system permease protein
VKDVITLLKPRLWGYRNEFTARNPRDRRIRLAVSGVLGLGFWMGIFVVLSRVLRYFQGIEGFGDILAAKLLSMMIVTFFALLLFSGIMTVLSKLYLSRDLALVHSLPVSPTKIFVARWIESTVDSSWMVVVYSLPVFLSYGTVYGGGVLFYATAAVAVCSLCLTTAALSASLVIIAAVVFPASRMRSIAVLAGIAAFVLLLLSFRLLQPERFADPDAFSSLLLYLKYAEMPGSVWLPTTWVVDALRSALADFPWTTLFHLALSLSFAFSLSFAAAWLAEVLYFRGLSQAQTAARRLSPRHSTPQRRAWIMRGLSGPTRGFVTKEVKTFFRDQTQWPQLILIAALIFIYIYNFSVLPLERAAVETFYLQNVISFLNVILTVFVLVAVAARFLYPAVSLEGYSFWIVKAAPISVRTFLWIKFAVYCLPLLIFAETLIIVTNWLLHVSPFMMILSAVTVSLIVPAIVCLGIGMGAAYPDFHGDNPAQSMTSFGGLLFMILSALFTGVIVVLEAGPVYAVLTADFCGHALTLWQWVWLVGSFAVVFLLSAVSVVIPMRLGERHLLR